MDVLVEDIRTTILVDYSAPYRPLWALASQKCKHIDSSGVYNDEEARDMRQQRLRTLKKLAKEGRHTLLDWIRAMRNGKRWTLAELHALMCAAAKGDSERVLRQCHDEWTVVGLARDVRLSKATAEKWAMVEAALKGHEHLVRLCHDEWNIVGYLDHVMAAAAEGGHEQIVRLCHDEWHASDVDWAMAAAAHGGHERIVRLCHDEWGAKDVKRAMRWATLHNHHNKIVQLCEEWIK